MDDALAWTEGSAHVPSRSGLTVRAVAEATRQVGASAQPHAAMSSKKLRSVKAARATTNGMAFKSR